MTRTTEYAELNHAMDDFRTFTQSDERSRPPSLSLRSLGVLRAS